MPFKALAPELVPLVHHIELAKAGWSLRLTEQLATAAACSSGQTASAADLRFSIEKQYGVRTTEADVRRAVGTLASKKILLEVEPGRFKASEGMCCNFPKAARERLVESAGLRLMPPPRTSC